jgi:uroporphyrinogen decarboxylase
MDALGVDVEVLWFGSRETKVWHTPFAVDLIVPAKFDVEDLPDGSSVVRSPQGTVYARRAAGAYYHDPADPPLADVASPADLDRFDALFERWDYSYTYDEPLDALGRRAKAQYESTDRAVVSLWRMHYLQTGMLMRGFEQFFVDLVADKDLTHALFSKLHRVYLDRVDAFLAAFGPWFDIVFLTDDLGTQKGGMISTPLYEEMVYPYISELVGRIKSAGKKVVMHSCGAVSDYVPYLIEMGVDALNPVQVSAQGMNPAELVRRYGKDIAFWGGGCDTQHALNAPDPEVVRADVRRRLAEYGPDASLVFTQVHNIQYDVPPRNILALRDEFFRQARA